MIGVGMVFISLMDGLDGLVGCFSAYVQRFSAYVQRFSADWSDDWCGDGLHSLMDAMLLEGGEKWVGKSRMTGRMHSVVYRGALDSEVGRLNLQFRTRRPPSSVGKCRHG